MSTKIFVWTVPAQGWYRGDVVAYAMLEDGHVIASHLSSNDEWAKHDMGLGSDWKHDTYSDYCPDGFDLVWVADPDNNPEWQVAFENNKKHKWETESQS